MKRVVVRNRQGVQTHGAELADPTEWIAEQVALNSWGKPQREVTADQEDVSGAISQREEILTPAQDAWTETIPAHESVDPITGEVTQVPEQVIEYPARPAETRTLYTLPAEYTIETQDMTAEIQERERIKREEELNDGLRKAAKARSMAFDIQRIKDPDVRAFLTDIRILISKWQ